MYHIWLWIQEQSPMLLPPFQLSSFDVMTELLRENLSLFSYAILEVYKPTGRPRPLKQVRLYRLTASIFFPLHHFQVKFSQLSSPLASKDKKETTKSRALIERW